MCFYHGDCDWYASVNDESQCVSDGTMRCDECHKHIRAGGVYTHLLQQEHELCQRCEDDCGGDYEENHPECANGKHDYGESYEHDICEECSKLLKAIRRVEEDDGCKGDETQPALGQLREAFSEADGALDYLDRAREMFPELAFSGHLDHFYKHTSEYHDWFDNYEWDGDDIGPTEELGGEG